MSRFKAFGISLLVSLVIIIPVYLVVVAYGVSRIKPTDTPQSGVPISQPMPSDAKTVLVLTGTGTAQTAQTYALVRFDAYENMVCTLSFPRQTVVLIGGAPFTLEQAVASAGPAQAVSALSETLDIPVDNYLFASPKTLCPVAEKFGTTRLDLSNYLDETALGALQLEVEGVQTTTLTPTLLAEILAYDALDPDIACVLRAQGYLGFLMRGEGQWYDVFPDFVRTSSAKIATNITATKLYEYERVLRFLQDQRPNYAAETLPGTWADDRFELSPDAPQIAQGVCGVLEMTM